MRAKFLNSSPITFYGILGGLNSVSIIEIHSITHYPIGTDAN